MQFQNLAYHAFLNQFPITILHHVFVCSGNLGVDTYRDSRDSLGMCCRWFGDIYTPVRIDYIHTILVKD